MRRGYRQAATLSITTNVISMGCHNSFKQSGMLVRLPTLICPANYLVLDRRSKRKMLSDVHAIVNLERFLEK